MKVAQILQVPEESCNLSDAALQFLTQTCQGTHVTRCGPAQSRALAALALSTSLFD